MDNKRLHVIFSQNFHDVDSFKEQKSRIEVDLPGGIDVLGIGIIGYDPSPSHAALQKALSRSDEPAVVLQWNGASMTRPVVRVMEDGLLKPFKGSPRMESTRTQNLLMRLPVNIRFSSQPSKSAIEQWFKESVILTTLDRTDDDADIFIQRGIVRVSDFHRPLSDEKRFRGIVTLTAVLDSDSDPSKALCQSLLRRLETPNPESPRTLYISQSACSNRLIFSVTKPNSFTGLRRWKNAFNSTSEEPRNQSKLSNLVHVFVALSAVLIMYLLYNVRNS